jgi:hypothetical protein
VGVVRQGARGCHSRRCIEKVGTPGLAFVMVSYESATAIFDGSLGFGVKSGPFIPG